MTQTAEAGFRECAFRVFSGCPNLVIDLQTDAVLSVFQKGLQDTRSVDVRRMTHARLPRLTPLIIHRSDSPRFGHVCRI